MEASATISVKYSKPGLSLSLSPSAVAYKEGEISAAALTPMVMMGAERQADYSIAALYRADGAPIAPGAPADGMAWTTDTIDGHACAVLVFSDSASVEGWFRLSVGYKDRTYGLDFSIARIARGEKGQRGAKPRFTRYSEVEYGFRFMSGAEGEEWFDITLYGSSLVPYRCVASHDKARTAVRPNAPAGPQPAANWEMAASWPFIATQLLLAQRACVKNLYAEDVDVSCPGGASVKINAADGIKATAPDGRAAFSFGMDGSAMFDGDISARTMTLGRCSDYADDACVLDGAVAAVRRNGTLYLPQLRKNGDTRTIELLPDPWSAIQDTFLLSCSGHADAIQLVGEPLSSSSSALLPSRVAYRVTGVAEGEEESGTDEDTGEPRQYCPARWYVIQYQKVQTILLQG